MNDLERLKDDYENSFNNNMIDGDQLNKCIRYINALEKRIKELSEVKI